MIFKTETFVGSERDVKPGDLVVCQDKVYLALNRAENGFLLNDYTDETSFLLERNQSIEIVKNIFITTG